MADVVVPRRKEILAVISDLAAAFTPERLEVLDLGCGAGEVAAAILERKPQAEAVLVDFSDEMIGLCEQRFAGFPGVRVLKHDLNLPLPASLDSEGFDVVVSCFSLHHVEFENRTRLYRDVCRLLKRGCLFINGDRFTGESPTIAGWEFDNFVRFVQTQITERLGVQKTLDEVKATQLSSDARLGDKPGTLWQMERDLRAAGFSSVDCIWKYGNLAIVAATK